MKKSFLVVISLLILVAVIVSIFVITKENIKEENYYGYVGLKEDTIIKKITMDDYIKLNDDNYILLLGYPECPACQEVFAWSDSLFKENNIDKVYYVQYKEEDVKTFFKSQGFDFLGTPFYGYFFNGEYQFSNQIDIYMQDDISLKESIELSLNKYIKLLNDN